MCVVLDFPVSAPVRVDSSDDQVLIPEVGKPEPLIAQ